jgi:hypothetical protein
MFKLIRKFFYSFSKWLGNKIKKNLNTNIFFLSNFSKSLFHFSSYVIFEKKKNYQKKTNKIDIIVWPIWGEKFYNFFLNFCLPSLLQKGNLLWMCNNYLVEIDIYFRENINDLSNDKNIKYLKSLNNIKVNFINCDNIFNKNKKNPMIEIFSEHVKKSISNKSLSIQILADLVYSENFFFNLINTIDGKNYCYTFTHARVDHKKISSNLLKLKFNNKNYNELKINSKKLVSLASKNLTHTMIYQNDKIQMNLTHTGISYREFDKHIAVVSNVLHPYFCNFEKNDNDFISNMKTFTETDRAFPSYLLMQSRLKVIASSNLLFAVELTDNFEVDKKNLLNQIYNDQKMNQHNIAAYIFNSIVVDWEKE